MPIFSNLKQVKYSLVFVGVAAIVFDISYYLMSTLPGSRDLMCVMGANLTPLNIGFSLIMSALIGLLVAGFIALFSMKLAEKKATLTSVSGLGMLAGMMSVFCTACTLPVLSLFGLSVSLEFITHYDVPAKVLSVLLLSGSLYMLNKQLKKECAVCVTNPVAETKRA